MIIARHPIAHNARRRRNSLPSYYREHEGFLAAAAIDRYVYITLHKTFVDYLIVKYSKLKSVTSIDELQHPIIREALKMLNVPARRLEISSMADIPAGTGLGSSGSFTTASSARAARLSEEHRQPAGHCRTGLPYRNRPARRTYRQTGPVHCRLRWRDLFPLQPKTTLVDVVGCARFRRSKRCKIWRMAW